MQEMEQGTAEQGGAQDRPTGEAMEASAEKRLASGEGKAAEENSADARIFTQKDVDHIVQQRLATEKARSAAVLAQKEQELRARALGYQARDALAERGLPVELMQVLDYTNEEAFAGALERLEALLAQRLQQGIENRLQGSVPRTGSTATGPDVRSAFGLDKGR